MAGRAVQPVGGVADYPQRDRQGLLAAARRANSGGGLGVGVSVWVFGLALSWCAWKICQPRQHSNGIVCFGASGREKLKSMGDKYIKPSRPSIMSNWPVLRINQLNFHVHGCLQSYNFRNTLPSAPSTQTLSPFCNISSKPRTLMTAGKPISRAVTAP